MPDSDREREDELAQLLREVRELRKAVDELKANQLPAGVEYNVATRPGPIVYADYPVTVRLPMNIAPPAYEVVVRSTVPKPDTSPVADE